MVLPPGPRSVPLRKYSTLVMFDAATESSANEPPRHGPETGRMTFGFDTVTEIAADVMEFPATSVATAVTECVVPAVRVDESHVRAYPNPVNVAVPTTAPSTWNFTVLIPEPAS